MARPAFSRVAIDGVGWDPVKLFHSVVGLANVSQRCHLSVVVLLLDSFAVICPRRVLGRICIGGGD